MQRGFLTQTDKTAESAAMASCAKPCIVQNNIGGIDARRTAPPVLNPPVFLLENSLKTTRMISIVGI